MISDDARGWRGPGAVAVALLLALTAMGVPAQAAAVDSMGSGPCVGLSDDPPFVGIGSCSYSSSASSPSAEAIEGLRVAYPLTSGSEAFDETDAELVGASAEISWAFDEDSLGAEVEAFHVDRGLSPDSEASMERIGTVGPEASSYVDEQGLTSGESIWYTVTAELADGTTERSQPFTFSDANAGSE
jgi:hypothetical protein